MLHSLAAYQVSAINRTCRRRNPHLSSLQTCILITLYNNKKVKWSRYRPGVAHKVCRDIALIFHGRGTRRRVSGQQHAPAPLCPWEKPGTHFTGGWVGHRAENLVPTGIWYRTVQPVVSRYTELPDPPCIIITVHKDMIQCVYNYTSTYARKQVYNLTINTGMNMFQNQ